MFGSSNPYSQPGDTQITLSVRTLRSTDHYNGPVEQVARQTLQTYVLNTQNAVDLSVSRTITERLSVSEHTVRHHLEHIYDKTGVHTRVAATLFAIEHSLLS